MMEDFEYKVKRSFNYYAAQGLWKIPVQGLVDNPEKAFQEGCLLMPM